MCHIISRAATFAFGSMQLGADGALFECVEYDCANAPLCCTRSLAYAGAPYLAMTSDLTSKLYRLFHSVATFAYVLRVSAVPSRMCADDLARMAEILFQVRELRLSDCVHSGAALRPLLSLSMSLRRLDLSCCSLTVASDQPSALQDVVSNLPSLQALDLSSCTGIRASDIQYLAKLRALNTLSLADALPPPSATTAATCRGISKAIRPRWRPTPGGCRKCVRRCSRASSTSRI